MSHEREDQDEGTNRRAFLGRAVTASAALGIGVTSGAWSEARADETQAQDRWLSGLKGKYRQVTDIYARTFLVTQGPQPDAGAVVILRHGGFVLSLGNDAWAKYKIGAAMNIMDPETKAHAVKNPFLRPKPGTLLADDMAIDQLLGRGVIFGACNVALQVLSGRLSGQAGVTPEVALKDWTAAVIPGIHVIPSGVWGVNRAQMAGCSYCSGG